MLPPVDQSPEGHVEPAVGARAAASKRRWTRAELIAIVAITLLAAVIRMVHLSDPKEFAFDEVYYAKDACIYAHVDTKECGIAEESTYVHPPLGKSLIALGVAAFGFDSFGWRIVPVVFGTLSVALLFLIARKIFRSLVAACAAALLLSLDLMHFVQSRVAMLDIFTTFFTMLAFFCLLVDREHMERRRGSNDPSTRRMARPWRAAAGIAAGAATACKWEGAFALVAIIVLTFVWERAARREDDEHEAFGRTFTEETPSIVLYLMILPVVTYAATYIGHLQGDVLALPWAQGSWVRNLV
ncbi:MAG: dolichyl-phosphate-mannose-protein mannosyltransferase, partial [Actinomycetota bacterium]|nr:dolichyl-phosphate-mannose-protein mannosyltransferase [Actinomycetota bacterium]